MGSFANEELAYQYLISSLQTIQRNTELDLEIEVHRPKGQFYTDFIGGFTNTYENVTNIVARLSAPGPESKKEAVNMFLFSFSLSLF